MKKIVVILLGVVFLMTFPMTAGAVYYTYTEAQLVAMEEVWDNPDGSAELVTYGSYGSGPEFTIVFTGWDTDGFAQIGIGDFDYSNRLDLTGYEGIQLKFSNSTYSTTADMFVNMFIQTYDQDADEWGNFYENTWTEIPEDATITLTLDFSEADYWLWGAYQGNGTVDNLGDVYKWGFQVGSNIPANEENLIHGTVNPVPEPYTLLLLGIGLLGVGLVRKMS